jgi:hypothetical protein
VPRALTARATVVALAAAGAALTVAGALPAGATTAYSVTHTRDPFTDRSTVVRWAPCTVTSSGIKTHYITYRVNPAGVPSRVRLVQEALAKVTAASGLRFRYIGTTSYVPHNAVLHYRTGDQVVFDAAQERARTGAELVIAWATRAASNLLTPAEAGVGTVSWSGSYTAQLRIVQAAVVMRRGVSLKPGFTAGASVGALLLHELGHAVGLAHVDDRTQIMNPVSTGAAGVYGAGDLAGLRILGSGTCLTAPTRAQTNLG